jgi:splicing factor 3A subunit 1
LQIDWHDFVIVETIDFYEDEDEELPPPMSIKELVAFNKQQALQGGGAAAAAAAAAEEAEAMEADEDAEQVGSIAVWGGICVAALSRSAAGGSMPPSVLVG